MLPSLLSWETVIQETTRQGDVKNAAKGYIHKAIRAQDKQQRTLPRASRKTWCK